jgi:cytochrome c556
LACLAGFALIVSVGVSAQRGAPPEGGRGNAPAQKPYLPVGTTAVAKNPDQFIGELVTLTASVETVLSKSAFAIDQHVKNQPSGTPLLVLAPILNGQLEANKYVTVAGEIVKFDPVQIGKTAEAMTKVKGYQVDLPPDLVEKFKGKPVIVAKVVVNDKMVDLAMRVPPPYAADEKALDETMKKVGPAAQALRTAVDASKPGDVTQQLAVLKPAFAQTEAFWKTKNVAEAAKIAQDAKGHVEAVDKAVASADWDAAKKSAAALNQTCGACHNTYRERFDDGQFRAKMPEKNGGTR